MFQGIPPKPFKIFRMALSFTSLFGVLRRLTTQLFLKLLIINQSTGPYIYTSKVAVGHIDALSAGMILSPLTSNVHILY